jgi:cyd operon protein YbgT
MWYFTWIIGLGFAVLLAVVAALWLEIRGSAER